MPKYYYTAGSIKKGIKTGTAEVKNIHELVKLLKSEDYFLIRVNTEEKKPKKINFTFFSRKIGLKEKIFFVRNLKIMICTGMSLPRAIKILGDQTNNQRFKKCLYKISEEINKGKAFSEILSNFSDIFSELFQNMIKVGEETGTMEKVLDILEGQMEKENELRSKVKGAMIYPIIIICAIFGIGFLMLTVVIPKLREIFDELEIELPVTTKFVLFLGTFLANYWYLVILIIIVFLFFFKILLKTKLGKKIVDKLFLQIPLVSELTKKINSAYFTRNLSSLISAGAPLIKSLEVTSKTLENFYFQKAIAEVIEKVKKGEKLSDAIKLYQFYPYLISQMIAIGEETGETSNILAKLADSYEEEVNNITKNLSTIIEPILMLLMGVLVGFFAISMIQPMYSVLTEIK